MRAGPSTWLVDCPFDHLWRERGGEGEERTLREKGREKEETTPIPATRGQTEGTYDEQQRREHSAMYKPTTVPGSLLPGELYQSDVCEVRYCQKQIW